MEHFLLPHIGLLFWVTLAFLLTFFILAKFVWKSILKVINERDKRIQQSLMNAQTIEMKMHQAKHDYDDLMKKAYEEKQQLLREAKALKMHLLNEAQEMAKVQTAKLLSDAQHDIGRMKEKALQDIKKNVVELAINVSEKVLREQFKDRKYQQTYIDKLLMETHL